MCYLPDKNMEDAPAEMSADEAYAWLVGFEMGFDEALDIIAERDAGESA